MKALVLVALFLFLPLEVAASGDGWSEGMRRWLLAMTYPVEDPDDFGEPVPPADRVLLERFRPRIYVSPRGLLPVDFYGFYLPRTVVRDSERGGAVVKAPPARRFLKSIERDKRYYLDYRGPLYPCEGRKCEDYVATGYGRVYRETARIMTGRGVLRVPVIILKYNFAFPFSGVPAELGVLREALLRLVADPVRFHELDIHGAVQIILNREMRPMVLLLAQHNHFRSYVIGVDIPALPPDRRMPVCFAERSNEPYPCPPGTAPVLHRAVGNPSGMGWVIDGRKRPLLSGFDRVYGPRSGAREVKYKLAFLPSKDPLYVSWIPLGERKKLLGLFPTFYRNGPPGMDLNSHPDLKRYSDMMQFWYLRDGSTRDADLMRECLRGFADIDVEAVIERNGPRLLRALRAAGHLPSSSGN